jgi:hypothetical protein
MRCWVDFFMGYSLLLRRDLLIPFLGGAVFKERVGLIASICIGGSVGGLDPP